jgi:superfamily II DNA or RNA helicase
MTWQALAGLLEVIQAMCLNEKVLVITDEMHHAAIEAAWGKAANTAFEKVKYSLILTGTPLRSDGKGCTWLPLSNNGEIEIPEKAKYEITYGECVDAGFCRPITFHRHEGDFSVTLPRGEVINVTSKLPANLTKKHKKIPGLQASLDFSRLVMQPQFEKNGVTPLMTGYQATMLHWACEKLDDLRLTQKPNAGGLVIAPNIEMAEYICKVIEKIEGDKPTLVHSNINNAQARIRNFKAGNGKWLVSVAMISEGVDIPRLRVLVYLPYALTELFFRQAMGRVIRNDEPNDGTRAYVVMPSLELLETYARRVEREMPPGVKKEPPKPKTKICPRCNNVEPISATNCSECDYEFPTSPRPGLKVCNKCGTLNSLSATKCINCGTSFRPEFLLSLKEALRSGAIVRGMDINEEDVKIGEKIGPEMRQKVLEGGHVTLIKVLSTLPDEMIGVMADYAKQIDAAKEGE